MRSEEPKICELPERLVACVSYKGNYMGNNQVFRELFDKLYAWAGPKGLISPQSVFLSSYGDDPKTTPPEELRLEVCLAIPEDVEVENDIQKKKLPGGLYAVMHTELMGSEEYGPAWEAIVDWTERSDYQLDVSRPSYEIYLNNPEDHPQKHHILDICLGVMPK